jgi:conjugative relaxase-like TrwC/TraI family protein
VLRIVQNQAAASAKTYYSHAAYYSEGQEPAGAWGGKAAERLGLRGTIEQPDFDALCDNINPSTGERLTARTKSNRTVGYDYNFHVPKGVSLAYALGGDERILTAFQDCVRETMDDVERDAETRVRVGGRQEDRRTGNLAWGEFIHKTARPVNGLPDPHLHAHCFVFNVTHDAAEDRFKAAQFKHSKQDANYYEALLHARLARRMKALGYTIERVGRHWDIAEIPKVMRNKFSRRRDQIEELVRARGITSDAQKDELGARSRERKLYELTIPELRERWLLRLDAGENAQLVTPSTAAPVPRDVELISATTAAEQSVSHCFERSAVVPERKVIAEALRRGGGEVNIDDIGPALLQQGLMVQEVNGRRLATTASAIAEEQAVIDFVRRGRDSAAPLNTHWRFQREWLSHEQKRAVTQLIESRDLVQVLHGGAGTGKTALMQEAAAAIEAGGMQLWAFAPSAQASRGVLRDEGFANATTVAELLVNESLQAQAAGQVWWIDEAGLLSTRQLKAAAELAGALGARIILSGDWRQHASVERGGLLRQLVARSGIKAAELGSIRRQHGSYKAAVKAIAAGDVASGFDQLDRLGWIEEIPDDSRDDKIARDYAAAVAAGESCLVVAPTHREADHLTFAIRQLMHGRGSLEKQAVPFRRLQPLHLTESERRDPAFYLASDVIEFHQNAAGHRKGERVTITGRPPDKLLRQASRYSVYRSEALPIAAGDRIRFTANVKTVDGKHRLNNGAVYTVAGATRGGDLRLSNGWVVGHDVGHVAYGYVTTSHGSQGRTVGRILLAESAESLPAAGAEQFYVSISRGRKRATVYTDDKRALRSAVQESQTGLTAGELVSLQQRQQAAASRFRARQRLVQSIATTSESPHSHLPELTYGSS